MNVSNSALYPRLRRSLRTGWLWLALLGSVLADASHPRSFPQVTVLSATQPDRGYVIQELIVGGKSFAPDHLAEAGQAALRCSGWNTAKPKKREQMALDWCTQVLQAGQPALLQPPEDFQRQKRAFQPPLANTQADGTTHVYLWVHQGGSMRGPANDYFRHHWVFSSVGRPQQLPAECWTP